MAATESVDHQFGLFPYSHPKAKTKKVPDGVQAVKEAKSAFEKGDMKLCTRKMAEAREALERKYGV